MPGRTFCRRGLSAGSATRRVSGCSPQRKLCVFAVRRTPRGRTCGPRSVLQPPAAIKGVVCRAHICRHITATAQDHKSWSRFAAGDGVEAAFNDSTLLVF